MERKLLQIAVAGLAGVALGLTGVLFGTLSRLLSVIGHGVPTVGIMSHLIVGLILVPVLWLWQRHVAGLAQRGAVS